MLENVIPLLSIYLNSGIFELIFTYIIPLAFLATVPIIIVSIIKVR